MSTLKNRNVLSLLALDPKNTHVREDAFSCTITKCGYKLIIAVVIPPIGLLKEEIASKSLTSLLNEKFMTKPNLFSKEDSLEYCLKENEPRRVLAVKYFITNDGKVKEELVIQDVARAVWIHHDNHNEIQLCKNTHAVIKMIHQNHTHGGVLIKKIKRFKKFNHSDDLCLSNLLLDTFSFSCRATCLKLKIPYYHAINRSRSVAVSNPYYGRFNRPMRDILALINLLNLYNHLTGKVGHIITGKELSNVLKGVNNVLVTK